jgi:hypothetical protein
MSVALWLLAIQGIIGAFDTLYYHEWRAQLPARGVSASKELKLHAARDFLYAVLFGTLPFFAWQGLWLLVLIAVIVAEIVLTLTDFVVEVTARKPMGDVYPGERITHAIMGILYGAMVANLIPEMIMWWQLPTAFGQVPPELPEILRWGLVAMAVGVFLSGVRDLYAALEMPNGNWPWKQLG